MKPIDTTIERPIEIAAAQEDRDGSDEQIRLVNCLPFLSIHLVCLGVIWVGWSWAAVTVAVALYVARMFVITAFYHRYFSHRTFRTHRLTQFLFALAGTTCAQRGPIWWAAHHRDHHRHSDEAPDVHSPHQHSMVWSHVGWFLSDAGFRTNERATPDLIRYPELRWLDRYHLVGPALLIASMYLLGWTLERWAPGAGTTGLQMVVWGFGISTTVLYHGTFTINSLSHMFGTRPFKTSDESRNNLVLALITMGEGWHNNHHYYPGTARQGFLWWEVDVTYYVLVALEKLGVVWDVRRVPARVMAAAQRARSADA